ncbi:serine hydrolase [Winogradskyella maritima]|uniref:Serine hydrolase n=1 Tax=Winogradskyella maritima TaxID=1517766 RepID=A0ABV8AH89_9FLAO|nr:serine hydrolase [Winogradskyella maritima]
MKRILALCCLILATNLHQAQTDKRLKGLTKELNTVLDITDTAGFAIAVVEGDKVLYAKGFGYRDYENKIPVDANTIFAIGSSTKAFTSAILGILEEEDKVDFDENPRKYIPELSFYNDNLNNNLIVRDLMRHSTGIPRHDGAWYFFPSKDKDSLLARVEYQEPFTGIRQQWYYNNFMFLAQGVIAERVTGKSWEDNIKELFLKPLGMDRTEMDIDGMKTASNASLGYRAEDGNIIKMDYYDIAGMSPAGSINSSVNDMTKWLMTWINDGKYKEKQIIPESYVQSAMSSQMVIAPALPSEKNPDIHFANYGYGWFMSSYKGHYRVEHGGNIDGFSASVAFFPSDDIGIVVLANQNGSAVPSLVRNTVSDYVLQLKKSNWIEKHKESLEKAKENQEEAEEAQESSRIEGTRPSHAKLDYTGKYENKGYGKFDIIVENDSLFTQLNEKRQFLRHYHYDTFELIDVVEGKVDTTGYDKSLKASFNTNVAGDISEMTIAIEPTIDPIRFERTPNELDITAEELEEYTGEFQLPGATFKTYVKDEKLHLFIKGQPEYELVPIEKDTFAFKILDGFKAQFVRGDEGNVNAVKSIQPNGTFTAKRVEK